MYVCLCLSLSLGELSNRRAARRTPDRAASGNKARMIANIYGCWKVKSPAWTPGAITEPWTANDGKKWVEVPAAKIVDRNGVVTADCAEGINEGIQEGAAEAGEGNECTTANHKHHDITHNI